MWVKHNHFTFQKPRLLQLFSTNLMQITFVNTLKPDHGPTICWAWCGPQLVDTLMEFPNRFFDKEVFVKKSADNKTDEKSNHHAKS